ncbi:MAG: hypothetical protein ACRERC_01120 [Candidatus Binatia bacterium]
MLTAAFVAWLPAAGVLAGAVHWAGRAVPWLTQRDFEHAVRRMLLPMSLLPLAALGRVLALPALPAVLGIGVATVSALYAAAALPVPVGAASRRRLARAGLLASLLPGLFLFQTTVVHDAFQYQATAVSLLFDRDFSTFEELFFFNSYRSYNPYPEGSIRYLGVPLLELPALLVGHLQASALRFLGWGFPANGFSLPYTFWLSLCSSAAGVAGVALTYRWVARRVGAGGALAAVALMLWASALPMFLFLWHGWTHTYSILGVGLFLLQRDRVIESSAPGAAQWYLLGLIAGVLCLIWPVNGLILVVPAIDLMAGLPAGRQLRGRGAVVRAAALAVGVLVGFLPQWAGWYGATGHWAGSTYAKVGDYFRWSQPMIGALLFSWSQHGLVIWHPLLVPAAGGLSLLRDRPLGLALGVWIALQVYVVSCWSVWWTGIGFGNRFFLNLVPPLTLGLAYGLDWVWRRRERFDRTRRALLVGVALLLVCANLSLLAAYRSDVIPMGIKGPNYVQDGPPSTRELAHTLLFEAPLTPGFLTQDFWINQSFVMARLRTALGGDVGAWLSAGLAAVLLLAVWGLVLHVALRPGRAAVAATSRAAAERIGGRRWRLLPGVACTIGLLAVSAWLALAVGRAPASYPFFRFDAGETILRPGQRASFVPQGYLERTREVDLISFLTYAVFVPQGRPVAQLHVTVEGGQTFEFPLVAGVHTAETSAYRPEVRYLVAHGDEHTVPVHEWITRAYSRAVYPAHAFLARFPLPDALRVTRVEVVMLAGGGDLVLRDVFLRGEDAEGRGAMDTTDG